MPAVRGTILALAEQLFMMVNISQMTRMRIISRTLARPRLRIGTNQQKMIPLAAMHRLLTGSHSEQLRARFDHINGCVAHVLSIGALK